MQESGKSGLSIARSDANYSILDSRSAVVDGHASLKISLQNTHGGGGPFCELITAEYRRAIRVGITRGGKRKEEDDEPGERGEKKGGEEERRSERGERIREEEGDGTARKLHQLRYYACRGSHA